MTGTSPITIPFATPLSGVGGIYWTLAALGLWWAMRRGAPWRTRFFRMTSVILLFGLIPGRISWEHFHARKRMINAMTVFEERCKSAGERISQTVDGVDGVLWMKWRTNQVTGDQFEKYDPYGRDCVGEDCIASYLFDYATIPSGTGGVAPSNQRLYLYVDSIDVTDGQRYRYTKESPSAPLVKQAPGSELPRYGASWEDISTREDREHWIAGGSLKVVDLQTSEVIAERIGYLMDPGQGNSADSRDPWSWARSHAKACPPVSGHNVTFITKVLKPRRHGD